MPDTIPLPRIAELLDRDYAHRDPEAAVRHFHYWLNEATALGDERGKLFLYSEMMGFYRKAGKEKEALESAENALSIVRSEGLDRTAGGATVFLNAATVYQAFGKPDAALPLFEEARSVYAASLEPNDPRFGGLYNNMALTLVALRRFADARECYQNALDVMSQTAGGEPEQAITYLNLADAIREEMGLEEAEEQIEECLAKAKELLDTEGLPEDGNTAFVLEKCAPIFGFYGHFADEKELKERSERIYERA